MARETKRVQLELPQKSADRLESLKNQTDAASYAEVIRNAMMAYSWMIKTYEDGGRLLVKDADGSTREVELFSGF